jgi:hypothetical protein
MVLCHHKQIDKYSTVCDCSFAVSIIFIFIFVFSFVQEKDWYYLKCLKQNGPLPSVPGSSDRCLLRAKLFGQR